MESCWLALIALALLCAFPAAGWAQLNQRPGARLPPLPEYVEPDQDGVLPKVPLPDGSDTQSLEAGRSVFIAEYRLSGNTVLTDDELAELLSPYTNREVTFSELAELSDALTRAYINRGYATSGAVIPSQTIEDGVLEIQLVEGVLVEVDVETDGRLRVSFVRERVERGLVGPVNVETLEERLQILQQDERIDHIEANLLPGENRGESVLNLSVREAKPYHAYFEASNYESPSVGALRGLVQLAHSNVTGFGDRISATYRQSEGLHGVEGSYAVPLTAYDTVLEFHGQYTRSEVVEKPFDALNIESRSELYGFTLSQPIYRTPSSRFELALTGEYRRSKSFLLGQPFSFSQGVEQGESKVAVVRFSQNWTLRQRSQAVAARSTFSAGLDALGATRNSGDIPDGQFFSWLGQVQYAQRIGLFDTQIITRAVVQLSDSPLLGVEQFSLGGHASVRGYRENAMVRDNGTAASIELRVPVLQRAVGLPRLEVGPFVDVGYSWSHTGTSGEQTLISAGLGVRCAITNNAVLDMTWAEALRDVPRGGEHDLQDSGFQFRLSASF